MAREQQMGQLDGKIILISGRARGQARGGAELVCQLPALVHDTGCDGEADWEKTVEAAAQPSRLHGLVNNAGITNRKL
jgi:NAD(P)-dependent dehydrogenase (short-subunit alcohol dehydrogenase family)